MKLFSKLIAGVLAAAVLFAVVPADVTRADSPRIAITLDTAFIRDIFSYPEGGEWESGGYGYHYGPYTTSMADASIQVNVNGSIIGCRYLYYSDCDDSNPYSRYMYFNYNMTDLDFNEVGESLDVTINGVPLVLNGSDDIFITYVLDGVDGLYFDIYPDLGYFSLYFQYKIMNDHPMFRLYNPNSGEHFYTADYDEREYLVSLGWNDEGIGWQAPGISNTPVYRLYNSIGGEHHYTTNAGERDMLVAAGWNYESVGWYSDDAQTVPLYRQYNPNEFANNHNYTASRGENDFLVGLGWRAEGIGWYGVG